MPWKQDGQSEPHTVKKILDSKFQSEYVDSKWKEKDGTKQNNRFSGAHVSCIMLKAL